MRHWHVYSNWECLVFGSLASKSKIFGFYMDLHFLWLLLLSCWTPLTSWFPKHDTWKIAKLKDGQVGRFRKLADSLSMCLECWKLRCASSNFPVFTISSCHAGKHEEQRIFLCVMRRISHSHNDNSGRNTKTNSLSSPLATHSPPPVAALSFLLLLCGFSDAVITSTVKSKQPQSCSEKGTHGPECPKPNP